MNRITKFLALEGNIMILAIQTFVSQIGVGMMYVIWQPYFLSTGISIIQLGTIQTILNVSTGIGLLTWGFLSDKHGRKPIIIISSFCRILSLICLVLSKEFIALVGFAFFMGLTAMWMMGNPARGALITESVESERRATAMSSLMTISQAVSTVMASAGGWIAVNMGYTPIFYISLLTDIVGLILLSIFLKETHKPETKKVKINFVEATKNFIIPEFRFIILYLIILIQGFGYGTAYSLFYGALTEDLGFTPIQLGILTASFNLVWAFMSIPVGKISDKIGRRRSFLMSFTIGLITVIGFITFKSPIAFIFFNAISALDMIFWLPSWTSYLGDILPSDKRSTIMGKLDAYGRLGSLPAAWLAGFLLQRYGFNAPLYVQICTLSISIPLVFRLEEPS